MTCETKSRLVLAAALLSAVFSLGCQSGGQSAAVLPSNVSQSIPAAASHPDQQSAGRSVPATPVSTQSGQESSVASGAASQFCPVTGAKLGSMGEPVPVTINGRTIHVCCQGCVGKLQQNPQKYLRPDPASSSGYLEERAEKDSPRYTLSDESGSSCGSGGGGCKSGCH